MRLPLILLALVVIVPTCASAYPDPGQVGRYFESECFERHDRRFVHDYLNTIPTALGMEMEGAACEVYAATSAHFVYVSVADTEGESLENYAFHLFEEWSIGDVDRHDGIMLLFVGNYLASGQSALRIEVGYGLEGVVNSRVTNDAWDIMVDARDRALAAGETDLDARAYAVGAGSVFLLETMADGYTEGGFPAVASDSPPLLFWLIVIIFVIIVIILLASSARGQKGWGYAGPTSPGWNSRGSSIWVPSSGGGLGGGGFGGGRSGGGGRGGRF